MTNAISQSRSRSGYGVGRRMLLAVGVLAVLISRSALAADPVVVGLVAPASIAVGETFTVEVTVGAVAALDAAHVILEFDPAVVEYVSGSESTAATFLGGAPITPNAGIEGEFGALINVSGIDGVSGEGVLVRVDFRAVGTGSSGLAIQYAFFGDGGAREIPSTVGVPPVVNVGVGPSMSLRNAWLYDPAPGGNGDGLGNPGERLRLRVRIRNDGPGGAQNVRVTLTSDDPGLTLLVAEVAHPTWPAKEARNNNDLLIEIASDAPPHEAILTVTVTADNGGPWQFTYTLPIVPLPPSLSSRNFWGRDKVTGNADGDANPGERVEIKARIRNEGDTEFQNVVATLSVDGGGATVVNGRVTHSTWPAGAALNNDGLVVDIGAAASGSVAFTLDITADNGGPWQFTYTLPVVALPLSMGSRSFWARDKVTGNADGDANPGERVEIKARIKNEGATDYQNVVATLRAYLNQRSVL